MSANLMLHWMLDLVEAGNLIADETGNRLGGTSSGNPKVVPDEKFGSCLYFDGADDSITAPDVQGLRLKHYTAEVWIKPEKPSEWAGILGKPGRNFNIWLNADGFVHHRFHSVDNTNAGAPNTANGSITWGKWHHVAITNDGQMARTYINGNLAAEGAVSGGLVVDNTPLIVGRDLDDKNSNTYKGCMAHISLYDDALSVEEIRRDMQYDETAASAFVRSHPIGFELYNEDNHHVLYIDDHPLGQTMSLDIVNTSTQNIELSDLGQTATLQKYHFELRFRPETLAAANLAQIKVTAQGWSLDRLHRPGQSGGTSLYLLHLGTTTLEKGKPVTLQLTGMNADGRGGTRGTRVELIAKNMYFSGEEALLEDTRLQYLDIVNHRGRRNIPLHVGFVGSDTVLSDGHTPNNPLLLRIANLSRDVGLRLAKGSRFRVSFDVQGQNETREWALVDVKDSSKASLDHYNTENKNDTPPPNWGKPERTPNLTQTVEWTVAPTQETTLQAGGYIILKLSGVIAPASIGHANIYINFEDIPGYENEQVTIVVQKSPLLFSNNGVGIGITDPGSYKLNIDGGNTRFGGSLHFKADQEIYFADNGQIRSLDNNHRILFRRSENKMELREFGDLVFSPGAVSGQENAKMVILANGNVGIGTKTPGSYKLNIEGGDTYLGGSVHIKGDLKLGAQADLFAWATQQKVRIVMGTVERDGKYSGTGFTCKRESMGSYRLKFTPPFSQDPIVLIGPGEKAMPVVYPGVWGDGDTLIYCRNLFQNPIADQPVDARFYFLAIGY